MAKPISPMGGERIATFTWAEDPDVTGYIDLDSWQVFDLVDNHPGADHGQGKKIGHKKNKYAKMAEKLQTWHIREKDKKEPKGKGGN